MAASIQLDRPHTHFTNLDFITGKVIVQLPTDTSISGIQVKLEGESRTRLAGPRHPLDNRSDKKKTELEVHKLLYKVLTVFPTPDIYQHGSSAVYTLAAGVHQYAFKFKFPFNNACSNHNSMSTNLNMAGLRLEVARDTDRHVRKSLPPSLSGFPGEADIKYYVKVTIVRPQFYKENIRAFANFNFLPIEPPRIGDPKEETYARRQHQFSKGGPAPQKKSLFRKVSTPSFMEPVGNTTRFSVDARLPNPPILTCNEPLPLRILVTKLTESSETIFLQMLQIELIAYTSIRAHDLNRRESGSWVIFSQSNMNIPLVKGDVKGDDAAGKEWKVDPTLWNRIPLPSSVAPSFETCNISRSYELEVRIGLTHGNMGAVKPDLVVLPLRIPVKVYSGIAPPQALLDAMAGRQSQSAKPVEPPASPSQPPAMPPRPTVHPTPAYPGDIYEDAPPSYEDAIAEDLGPVDGPRREYNPPDASASGRRTVSGADVKSPASWEKDSERLFPDSGGMSNLSVESFDMIPSSSSDSRPGSANTSPTVPQEEACPTSGEIRPDEQPPQYQAVQQTPDQAVQRRPSRTDPRMNLGVPNRKPVPGSPNVKQSPTS